MSALAPRWGELRLLAGPDGVSPHVDVGVGPALLDEVARRGTGGWLRLYRPARSVAFGRLDRHRPGFAAAVAAAQAAGYPPVLRAPGGRAAVYGPQALCLDLVVADPDPRTGTFARFAELGDALLAALRDLGVAARVGAVEGEYCPGRHSVSAGRRKLAGTAQRIVRRGWYLGALLQVDGAAAVREVVGPVYAALAEPCDPRVVGAVADFAPGVTVSDAAAAVCKALADRVPLRPVPCPPDLLSRAEVAAGRPPLLEPVS